MKNIILLTHGEFSKGIAQSCQFILGEVENLAALSITLDETVEETRGMILNAMQAFGNNAPTLLITDIPGGSTTQAAIQVMASCPGVYLVTGLNLGLLLSLITLDLTGNDQEDLSSIREIVEEARETITLVNDLSGGDELSDDGEL